MTLIPKPSIHQNFYYQHHHVSCIINFHVCCGLAALIRSDLDSLFEGRDRNGTAEGSTVLAVGDKGVLELAIVTFGLPKLANLQ